MKRLFITCFTATLLWSSCDNPYVQGERLYQLRCANCHMEDGSGLAQAIPSLTKSTYKRGDLNIACLIRNGIAASEQLNMPANKDLTSSEITNIINFMRNEFWRDPRFAHPEKVEKALKKCE